MPIYEFHYKLTEVRKVRIEADSESAARQSWIDGAVIPDTDESVEVLDDHVLTIEVITVESGELPRNYELSCDDCGVEVPDGDGRYWPDADDIDEDTLRLCESCFVRREDTFKKS